MKIKFCWGLFFQAWDSLTSLKSQTRDPQLKVPLGGLLLRIFMSWKNPSTSAGLEPANLGSRGEHVTPRPTRPTSFFLTLIGNPKVRVRLIYKNTITCFVRASLPLVYAALNPRVPQTMEFLISFYLSDFWKDRLICNSGRKLA